MLGRTRRRTRARYLGDAGSGPVLLQGPVWDGFTGSGGLVGRTTESGGLTWELRRYTGVLDPTNIATSGTVVSSGTGSPFQGFAVINRAATRMRVRRRGNTVTTLGIGSSNYNYADHITAVGGSGVANWLFAGFDAVTGDITAASFRRWTSASTSTTYGSAINAHQTAGDSISVEYNDLDTATPTGTVYHNGQRLIPASIIDETANPITYDIGLRGGLNMNADEFMLAVPATDRFIELIAPGKNLGARDNGDMDAIVFFRCSIDAPAVGDIKYSYLNASTLAPITGHDQQPVTNYQTGVTDGVLDPVEAGHVICRAQLGLLASADYPAAGIVIELRRNDVTPGSVAVSRSPIILRSDVGLLTAQSLTQQQWVAAGTLNSQAPVTTPTGDFLYDGTDVYDSANLNNNGLPRVRNRRNSGATNASPNKQLAGILQNLTGRAVGQIMSGVGATSQYERNNRPTFVTMQLIGIANAYCRPTFVQDTSGQFEIQIPTSAGPYADFAACLADYPTQIGIEHDRIETFCGMTQGTLKRMFVPGIPILTADDANMQAFRRVQAVTMPADGTGRYVRGPYVNCCYRAIVTDPNPSPSDIYHLSQTALTFGTSPVITHPNSGYGIQARRVARRRAHLLDPISNPSDFNGPIMQSAAITSATTIDVTFDPNGGTLNVRNTAYLSDFRCGLDFRITTDMTDFNTANDLFPTNATVSGNVVTFTFGATLPATVYIAAARGARAFYRDVNSYALHTGSGTTSIAVDPFVRASMVCSDYTGAQFNDFGTTTIWVEVQPSFNAGGVGVDYVTAV